MNTARNRTQLFERLSDLVLRLVQSPRHVGIAAELMLEQLQFQRQRDQALLRAVVKVALEALTLGLAGLHNARP